MSQLDFVSLMAERPDLAAAWLCIADWLHRSKSAKFLDIRRLAHECEGVDLIMVNRALAILVDKGLLHQAYRVVAPDGNLLDQEFDSLTEIPPRMPDRFDHYFDTAEGEVVPIFRLEASRGW